MARTTNDQKKHGKKYLKAKENIDRLHLHEPEEALSLVKEKAVAVFDETVDLSMRLGVNPKHADQQVRGAVVLPKGVGKEVSVLVFAKGEKAKEAEDAGADYVGDEDLVAKIQEGWLDFDVAVATPDMMRNVGKLGRILGPRGMMPNPKVGTVTFEVEKAVKEIKSGKVEFRVDKAGNIHLPVGKVSFSVEDLAENFFAVTDTIVSARPAAAKGQYILSLTVSSTMGPGVKVNPADVLSRRK